MKKLIIIWAVALAALSLVSTNNVLAVSITEGNGCRIREVNSTNPDQRCDSNLICKVTDPATNPDVGTCQPAQINIDKPEKGFATLGNAISNILTVAFAVAVLIVLVMLIWGAFEWIVSGGDKEAVGKARGRIINALIGLAVLAIAFALARVAGQFTGLDLQNLVIPQPDPNAKGL